MKKSLLTPVRMAPSVKPRVKIALLCTLLMQMTPTNAQDWDTETISVSTGQSRPVASVPAVATVITREEIETQGYRTLEEALNQVTGLHSSPTTVFGLSILSARGYTGIQTYEFLVDGRPHFVALYGSKAFDVLRIPMETIEKIEILKGTGSSIYTSQAMMGVVNIVTKKDVNSTLVRGEIGSFNTKSITAITGFDLANYNTIISLDASTTEGHKPFYPADSATVLDNALGTETSLAPGHGNSDDNYVSLEATARDGDNVIAFTFGRLWDQGAYLGTLPVLDDKATQNQTSIGATSEFVVYEVDVEKVKGSLSLDYRETGLDDIQYFPPGTLGIFPDGVLGDLTFEELVFTGRLNGNFTGIKRHNISYSWTGKYETGRVSEFSANYDRSDESPIGIIPAPVGQYDVSGNLDDATSISFKVNDEITLHPSLFAHLGFAAEYHSEYDATFLPRAALIYNRSQKTTYKAMVGQGFRDPLYAERLDIGSPSIGPNPDVKPERITSVDFVVNTQFSKRLGVSGNLFYHVIEDQVSYGQQVDEVVFTPFNTDEQRGYGFEGTTEYKPTDSLSFKLNGAYQFNKGDYLLDNPVEEKTGFHPYVKISTHVGYTKGPFSGGAKATYVGDRDRRPLSLNPDPDEYTRVDVAASYKPSDSLEVKIKVENVLDDDTLEMAIGDNPFDNELPGRAFFLSLAYEW